MDLAILWRHKQFTKLWLAQIFSAIAGHLLNFTLLIRAFELAQGTRYANIAAGLLVLSYGVPAVIVAPIAGVYADLWPRRRTLIITNVLRVALAGAFFLFAHGLWQIVLLSVLIAAITQFFIPAESASIPGLVGKDDLLTANTLFVLGFYLTFVIGYSAATPLIGTYGYQSIFLIAMGLWAIATFLVAWLPDLKTMHDDETPAPRKKVVSSVSTAIAENWRIILAQQTLYLPIVFLAAVQGVLSMILTLAPALAIALFNQSLTSIGQFLIIPAAIGMLVGAAMVRPLTKRFHDLTAVIVTAALASVSLALLGSGAAYRTSAEAIVGLSNWRWAVAAAVFVMGSMNAVLTTVSQTMLQEGVSDDERGKVFGALNMCINIAQTLPVLVAAALADVFGVGRVVVIIGLALASGALWGANKRRHLFK